MSRSNTMITRASSEWATRPNDQRYETLAGLRRAVEARREASWTRGVKLSEISPRASADGEVLLDLQAGYGVRSLTPTNWAFRRLANYAHAPAGYLQVLPAELAVANLRWGLEHLAEPDVIQVLGYSNGSETLRALTSTKYGRIWDLELVKMVERFNQDGRWQVPAASYSATDPKKATTLYASDRDVFLFLVDPETTVDVGGESLFRGFYAWNSETGAKSIGVSTFYYRWVCDNRIIWGAEDVKGVEFRHTKGAPARLDEVAEMLTAFMEASPRDTAEVIRRAMDYEVQDPEKADDGWEKWLRSRGFGKGQAREAVLAAIREEGQCRSLWDVVQGMTAVAREVKYTDERVRLEEEAGKLLQYAAA